MNLKIEKPAIDVVCDVSGCGKVAEYFIKRTDASSDGDSLKLCPDCCEAILKLLQKIYKKGKVNENN